MRIRTFGVLLAALLMAALLASPAGAGVESEGPQPPAESTPAPDGPAPEAVLAGATQVTTSYYHSCAVLANRQVRCWGYNGYGELGNDSGVEQHDTAVVVKNAAGGGPLQNVRQVVAGDYHTCALLTNGQVRCWGYNSDGELGNGDDGTDQSLPVAVRNPADTGPLQNVIEISAEDSGACALLANRTVVCWGDDDYGQLGNGAPLADSDLPVVVKGLGGNGTLTNVASLGGGYDTNCVALLNGQARCWGYNSYGGLGNGTIDDTPHPVVVQDAATGVALTNVAQLTHGGYHGCATLTNGQARCWGDNDYGQLGTGTTDERHRAVPVGRVGGGRLLDVEAIYAGYDHTCALLGTGQARCWGYDADGENGDGTIDSPEFRKRPNPVRNGNNTANLAGIVQLYSRAYTACAVLNTGRVRCWGYGTYGGLGDGNATDSPLPVLVQI